MSIAILLSAGEIKRVQLPPGGIFRTSFHTQPTNSAAGFRLHSDGTIDATPGHSTALSYSEDLGSWLLTGVASDYQARISPGSPNAFSGQTENTWHTLSTTRDWYAQVTSDAGGVQDCGHTGGGPETLEIRETASPNAILASCTVGMKAEVDPG